MLIANKPFPFSRDGVTLEQAIEGEPVDLPEALVPGMTAGGFVIENKALTGAPESKTIESCDANGDTPEMAAMRDRLDAAYGELVAQFEAEQAKVAELTAQIELLTAQKGDLEPQSTGYSVLDKGNGWLFVTKDGTEVTKGLRKTALEGFEALDDEAKSAFVEANKPE